MKNIIINDEIVTKKLLADVEKQIEELESSNMDIMNNYMYLYNMAWMKLYVMLNKNIENGEKREGN